MFHLTLIDSGYLRQIVIRVKDFKSPPPPHPYDQEKILSNLHHIVYVYVIWCFTPVPVAIFKNSLFLLILQRFPNKK